MAYEVCALSYYLSGSERLGIELMVLQDRVSNKKYLIMRNYYIKARKNNIIIFILFSRSILMGFDGRCVYCDVICDYRKLDLILYFH